MNTANPIRLYIWKYRRLPHCFPCSIASKKELMDLLAHLGPTLGHLLSSGSLDTLLLHFWESGGSAASPASAAALGALSREAVHGPSPHSLALPLSTPLFCVSTGNGSRSTSAATPLEGQQDATGCHHLELLHLSEEEDLLPVLEGSLTASAVETCLWVRGLVHQPAAGWRCFGL